VGSASAKAELLGLLQGRRVLGAALRHGREDVVGRAVDDAHDVRDLGSGQRLAQHLDDRYGPHGAGLEAQERAVVLGRLEQLGAMLREELLVGRHDGLAGLQ